MTLLSVIGWAVFVIVILVPFIAICAAVGFLIQYIFKQGGFKG